MKRKILVFIGTRPEFVKLAPLVSALRARPKDFEVRVCLTSQHREMLRQMSDWFGITIDDDFEIMREKQGLSDIVASILPKASALAKQYRPDTIVVQGDTGTTFAAALAGFHADIPVAHVEAGLRSDNRAAPWPEEIYRRLVSRIALYHFAPTEDNARRLRDEKTDGEIHVVGNTAIDALLHMHEKIQGIPALLERIRSDLHSMGFAGGGG